jgi:ATP-dependent Clp protease ATP-binding subunit ClpA
MYIYICTGVGYVGSTSGTQLSNFIAEYNSLPSVVLLDEFDHCDPETWEAFYHIFDEGVFTQKKAAGIIQISI